MADRNTLQQMASASYQPNAPLAIQGWTRIGQTPTLKFYMKDTHIVVAIRGTQPTDPNDLSADGLIGVGQLASSSRFQTDLATLKQFQITYPSPPYHYTAVGHSLGGAILDEFLKQGLVSSGLSYNPAVQIGDFQKELPNQRVYVESDPLYKLMGQYTKGAEVRKKKGESIWGRFLKQVPYLGSIYDKYSSHALDNFVGGTHREDFFKKHNLSPSTKPSLRGVAKISGIPLKTLQEVYNRGIGAYKTNPQSVRMKGTFKQGVDAPMSKKLSKEQWAWGRVYSYLMGSKKHDTDLRGGRVEDAVEDTDYFGSSAYLKEAKRKAKQHGYDPSKLSLATDGDHKLKLVDEKGRTHTFGKKGMGDHLIYLHLETKGRVPKGTASQKKNTFQKSHTKIRGNWKSNPYSPNNLALRILW